MKDGGREGREKPTTLPWGITGPGKYDEHSLTEPGGKVIAYLRKLTAFQDDRMDVVNGEFICKAVNAYDSNQATIWELVEAGKAVLSPEANYRGMYDDPRIMEEAKKALRAAIDKATKGRI